MSQRNPMNDRYTSEEHKGVAKKSAASAKPTKSAAATVTINDGKKSDKEKKQQKRLREAEERKRQNELAAKYSKPDTPEYKKWRKAWWIGLGCAILLVLASWVSRSVEPQWISLVVLAFAYVAIIFAFWVDIVKIKKITRKYQEEMAIKDAAEKKKKYKGLSKREIAEIENAEIAEIKAKAERERQERVDRLKFWKKKVEPNEKDKGDTDKTADEN